MFIAQNQCRLPLLRGKVVLQPLGYVACGNAVRTGGHEGHSGLVPQVVVDAGMRQGVGETEQVFSYEVASLEGTVLQIHPVKVPIEEGLSAVLQIGHQFLFRPAEHVEAHKAKRLLLSKAVKQFLPLHGLALQGTLVWLCPLGHALLQLVVEFGHDTP